QLYATSGAGIPKAGVAPSPPSEFFRDVQLERRKVAQDFHRTGDAWPDQRAITRFHFTGVQQQPHRNDIRSLLLFRKIEFALSSCFERVVDARHLGHEPRTEGVA